MQPNFETEARLISSRNLTPNVAAVAASLDNNSSHLEVIYYLLDIPTPNDEDFRELTFGEIIAAFPSIRTAASRFERQNDLQSSDAKSVVFKRA